MLRAAIICPDQELTGHLDQALVQLGRVAVVRVVDHYPDAVELGRLLRASAPQILFVSTEAMARLIDMVKSVETQAPGIQIIAISRKSSPETLLEAMRGGVREFLSLPFERQDLYDSITHVSELLAKFPPQFEISDLVFSFLPSKAGVGASTIALNLATALSHYPDTKVALSDFDLNSGMLRFMLKLQTSYSVSDALEHAVGMEEVLWPQLVTSIGKLDVLHAGKLNPNLRIEATQIRYLLDFMRRNYRALCFDMSGNLERYSFELMHESKKIFLVCTPEIPSLHLAREKYTFLKTMDLADRCSIILNRVTKRQVVTAEQIEQILGVPVTMTLPNDYPEVSRALTEGKTVNPKSELGRAFTHLAGTLLEQKPDASKKEAKKSFIEFFSVSPSRITAK